MTRFSHQLLGALFVFGCGSGAVAAPSHGQWVNYDPDNDSTNQATAAPTDPTFAGTTQVGCPQQAQSPQSQSTPPAQSNTQSPDATQTPPPDQSSAQARGQDQDDADAAETFAWSTGQSHLGVMVMGLTPELRQFWHVPGDRGVLVAQVEPGSAAARAGIQVGDVLVRVGRQPVRSGDDVLQALAAQGGGRIRVAVIRQGRAVRLDAVLPKQQQSPDQGQI